MTLKGPKGALAKGNKAELRVRRWVEKQEGVSFVIDGRPTEPGCDLLAFYLQEDGHFKVDVFEVKAGDWNRLSSAKRKSAAYAGDLWRSRGMRHAVIDRAATDKPRIFTVGLVDGHASTLLKAVEFAWGAPVGGIGLGLERAQAPKRAERAGVGRSQVSESRTPMDSAPEAPSEAPAPANPHYSHLPITDQEAGL